MPTVPSALAFLMAVFIAAMGAALKGLFSVLLFMAPARYE
jgi:hypothetical protein